MSSLIGCAGVTRGTTTPSGDQTAGPTDTGTQNLPIDPNTCGGSTDVSRKKADGSCLPSGRASR